ncbi:AAA family ATPase [Dysgonomonas sp. BGC7]|uniref:AAA family ATPase n=1 Tax=Dysgonomonas sp. BGC7 TaxID=1658008 RepID=UPI000683046D|nr:AAA family ATPase [Dysgonomonas sp. BGC7]MBD8387427.1 AAA family ATPase [Dysgonomonas sp. BGC7]
MASINPNSDRQYIDTLNIEEVSNFPKYLKSIELRPFRHILDLKIDFIHPISILTGSNRIGKSTILIAIACSHFRFDKRNPSNGKLERFTWGSIMRFTKYDKQLSDWSYWLEYRIGTKIEKKRGQRKAATNKWNGIAKKESQIKDRQVIFIDLDRISPIRNSAQHLYTLAKQAPLSDISITNKQKVFDYLSYILEENFEINKIVQFTDKDVFRYKNSNEYSSYNSASGEDVLTRILIDVVEADRNALILIDEIEIGLHPKIQRRLVDILYFIARTEHKQFVISTHSPTIISAFNRKSRIFIERQSNGILKSISEISINAAFTKMDSRSYPLINLYCEDDISESIIKRAIVEIQNIKNISNFGEFINIIVSGSADKTHTNFIVDKRTYDARKIKTGYACVLDGDMKNKKDSNSNPLYPTDALLFFIFSDRAPEKFLLEKFLINNANSTLKYHLENTNPHALFNKMVECSVAVDRNNAFDLCWAAFLQTTEGVQYFNELQLFLQNICSHFSPDL